MLRLLGALVPPSFTIFLLEVDVFPLDCEFANALSNDGATPDDASLHWPPGALLNGKTMTSSTALMPTSRHINTEGDALSTRSPSTETLSPAHIKS